LFSSTDIADYLLWSFSDNGIRLAGLATVAGYLELYDEDIKLHGYSPAPWTRRPLVSSTPAAGRSSPANN
jgi:hypothetical protein